MWASSRGELRERFNDVERRLSMANLWHQRSDFSDGLFLHSKTCPNHLGSLREGESLWALFFRLQKHPSRTLLLLKHFLGSLHRPWDHGPAQGRSWMSLDATLRPEWKRCRYVYDRWLLRITPKCHPNRGWWSQSDEIRGTSHHERRALIPSWYTLTDGRWFHHHPRVHGPLI